MIERKYTANNNFKTLSCLVAVGLTSLITGCSFEIGASTLGNEDKPQTVKNASNVEVERTTSTGTKSQLTKNVEKAARKELGKVIGVPITSISCPNQVKLEPGQTFDCPTVAENKEFITRVRATDGNGSVHFATKNLLVLPLLENNIQTNFQQQTGIAVTTSCGGDRLYAFQQPGETLDCNVTDRNGDNAIAKVTIQDEDGNVKWNVN